MKKITIFEITFMVAVVISFITIFQSCQKEIPIDELNETTIEIKTETIVDEDHVVFDNFSRSGPDTIFMTAGEIADNILMQASGQPRVFIEFNKHSISKNILTKLAGTAGINGVIHSKYKVEIRYKDNSPSFILESAYVAGTAPSYEYAPIGLDNSLIHISSTIKWKKVSRQGSSTLLDYYDDYYCLAKKNYKYTITTANGYSSELRKNGSTQTSNIYVPKNI